MTAPFQGSASDKSWQQLRGKSYRRLTRDVYVLRSQPLDLRTRCQAALVAFPDARICLWTAGALLNLPVDDDGVVHLDRGPKAPATERAGIRTHRFGIPPGRLHDLNGMQVADGPRLVADLAEHLDLEGWWRSETWCSGGGDRSRSRRQ